MKPLSTLFRLAATLVATAGATVLADGPYNNGNGPAFIVIDFCSNGIGNQPTINPTNGVGFQFNPVSPAVPQLIPGVFDIGIDIDADGTVDRWLSQEPASFLADSDNGNSDAIQYTTKANGGPGWVHAYFYQLSPYVGHKMQIHIVDKSANYYMAIKSIRVNGADGVIVPNALKNGFFEQGLTNWTVTETSVANPASLIYRDTASEYLYYGTNFFTTRTDPTSSDSSETAVLVSDTFVLPPITSFIYGSLGGGVSEFVNNPGANGSDNASGVYIDLGDNNTAPNGKYDAGHDLPITGFWPGPGSGQDRDLWAVFINTSGLEGRKAQIVGFDNSQVFSIGMDAFRMNWDWEESIIKNGGFDQGLPTPESDPNATDWFMELGDGTLTAASHPSGSIPNWTVTKGAGATADAFFFDNTFRHQFMSGRTFIGTGGGDPTLTGVEIRSDVFTITPIPDPTNSVFVSVATAQCSDRIRYEDDGSNKYYGLAELIVDVNTNGIFGDTGDFHYVQHDQAPLAGNRSTVGEHDVWAFPVYRFYIKPEHQGLPGQFHAAVHMALADNAPKNGWSWIAVDDLFVWDGSGARLAFPNSDFEMGSLTNWITEIDSLAWEPTFTNWLSGNLAQYEAGLVNNLILNDHASSIDGNFAADSAPNEVPNSNSDSDTGEIRSIPFTLPTLAVTPPVLAIASSGGVISLTWTGSGTLQSAPSPLGPYTPVSNGASPYTVSTATPETFYRLLR